MGEKTTLFLSGAITFCGIYEEDPPPPLLLECPVAAVKPHGGDGGDLMLQSWLPEMR